MVKIETVKKPEKKTSNDMTYNKRKPVMNIIWAKEMKKKWDMLFDEYVYTQNDSMIYGTCISVHSIRFDKYQILCFAVVFQKTAS